MHVDTHLVRAVCSTVERIYAELARLGEVYRVGTVEVNKRVLTLYILVYKDDYARILALISLFSAEISVNRSEEVAKAITAISCLLTEGEDLTQKLFGEPADKTLMTSLIEFVCNKIDFNFIPAIRTENDALRVVDSLIEKELETAFARLGMFAGRQEREK